MGIQMHGAGGGGPPIVTIQPDAGTSPIGSIFTFTSTDGSVTITGDESTDTINFTTPDKGDVDGPASSTDNAIARFDGTTGKIIQNSGVTINDTGSIAVPSAATISNPGAGANSEKFGLSTTAVGASSVAIGNGASCDAAQAVVVGQGSSATGSGAVVIGQLSANTGSNSISIGYGITSVQSRTISIGNTSSSQGTKAISIGDGANAARANSISIGASSLIVSSGSYQVVIGDAASSVADASVVIGGLSSAGSGHAESVVLGYSMASTAANQFIVGSTASGILNAYFGKGVTHATPASSITIQPTGGSGTNIAGGGLVIAGGKGTGNAAGGSISFSTSDAGASGTALQSLTAKMTLTTGGSLGIGTTGPTGLLDINSDVVRVRTAKTPASATATGNQGDICWDTSYLYVCTATDTWRRVAHASW